MAKGLSLHIGLNSIDSKHYNGWSGKLRACEKDATDMEAIAAAQQFETRILLGKMASRENVINHIKDVAQQLEPGDIFFISYSGHGAQLPDLNGDEPDGLDEIWCLYNGGMLDDELDELWTLFKSDVRILVISDSCHSGTIVKSVDNVVYSKHHPRFMDFQKTLATYLKNKDFYDGLLQKHKDIISTEIELEASIILISGCQDNQYSFDGVANGAFTAALKRTWRGGQFEGSYRSFHRKILNILPAYQSPNFLTYGKVNKEFENQRPFTI